MSAQLESRHFYRIHDTVQNREGLTGEVVEGWALFARIRWLDGREQEVDQFDPAIEVLERASGG